MKKIHFIAQAKGGVGKSLLMYLFALKFGHDSSIFFVDLDSSTESSKRQLKFWVHLKVHSFLHYSATICP
jgi:cellulose biosynthesis protein BcsQ